MFIMTHPGVGEVWQLHRVTDKPSPDAAERVYEITPSKLIALIESRLKRGFHFVSLAQIQEMIASNVYDKKFISITLDDGYEDNLTVAYPIFKKYNIPFCIFIAKSYICEGRNPYTFMTEDQIREINKDPLCTIGSHTVTHRRLYNLAPEVQLQEIIECKAWLEEILQEPVPYFAYPYGSYTTVTLKALHKAGVQLAVRAWGGPVRATDRNDVCQIHRIIIKETSK